MEAAHNNFVGGLNDHDVGPVGFGAGDLGTPGAANDACAADPYNVGNDDYLDLTGTFGDTEGAIVAPERQIHPAQGGERLAGELGVTQRSP